MIECKQYIKGKCQLEYDKNFAFIKNKEPDEIVVGCFKIVINL